MEKYNKTYELLPGVGFNRALAPGAFVRRDQFVRLQIFSSAVATLVIESSFLYEDLANPIPGEETLVTDGTRAAQTLDIQTGDGVLQYLVIRATSGNFNRGQIFCRALIMQGQKGAASAYPRAVILSDYVTLGAPIGFPFSSLKDATSGLGNLTGVVGTFVTPNVQYTVPTNTRWRIASLRFGFTTDATVANRNILIRAIDNPTGSIVAEIVSRVFQTASLGWIYDVGGYWEYNTAFTNAPGGQNPTITLRFPSNIFIRSADTFLIFIMNAQATDSLGSCVLYVEEWLDV